MPELSPIQILRNTVNKEFGAGSVITFQDLPADHPALSTGVWALDKVTGIGGLPLGGIVELYGPESSGKSTVLLHTCAQSMARGWPVLYLDYENALDPTYAKALGVDIANGELFHISQPWTLEQGMAIAEAYIRSGLVGLIVVDSLAAMVARREVEDSKGNERSLTEGIVIGAQGLAMATVLKRITKALSATKTCMCFINQERIDLQAAQRGIKKKTTPGSGTLKYYALMRIEFRKIGGIRESVPHLITGIAEDKTVGTVVEANVVKNKCWQPFHYCQFVIGQGTGYDAELSFVTTAIEMGIIKKAGSSYDSPTGEGQSEKIKGQANVAIFYKSNPTYFSYLKSLFETAPVPVSKTTEDVPVENIDELLSENSAEETSGTPEQ